MKVVYHEDYNQVYTSDPAAARGRIQAVVDALEGKVTWVTPEPASESDILQVHTQRHVDSVKRKGIYDIAALAAGGAIKAAQIGLTEPCFAVIRPPDTMLQPTIPGGFAISTIWPLPSINWCARVR